MTLADILAGDQRGLFLLGEITDRTRGLQKLAQRCGARSKKYQEQARGELNYLQRTWRELALLERPDDPRPWPFAPLQATLCEARQAVTALYWLVLSLDAQQRGEREAVTPLEALELLGDAVRGYRERTTPVLAKQVRKGLVATAKKKKCKAAGRRRMAAGGARGGLATSSKRAAVRSRARELAAGWWAADESPSVAAMARRVAVELGVSDRTAERWITPEKPSPQ